MIYTDGNRLKQVLINLISNAIKYTKTGEVRIEAVFNNLTRTFKIGIVDTGVGIEQDKLKDLFSTFTKIDRHRNLNKEGVGLGLVICKNIVEALNGSITVLSTVG